MLDERSTAVIQTEVFWRELSRGISLPERICRNANFLLHHCPSPVFRPTIAR
ncbi:BPSL0761 family protein [Pseudomonas sp. SED1]|uniref:BPSL0761 family protein n=1 Tax=Pseudomonas sp. SED1 TaxID=3056845 RepID=UPI00296EA7C8|nr:BPSL0761 family protein [Pseudomonas sp. SED1]MDY0836527.1 BPSL0761 family protein [Pseudomonas sp. SED1]